MKIIIPGYYLRQRTVADINPTYDFIVTDARFDIKVSSLLQNLKECITHAIRREEDLICCILEDFKCNINFDLFETSVSDLISQDICSFYLSAVSADRITFSKNYSVLENIEDISAFILTRPLYQYVLNLLDENSFIKMDELEFLKRIIPHSILLHADTEMFNTNNLKIHIVSPFRNSARYLSDCWNSIAVQQYSNYHVYFIDDHSDDDGTDMIPDNVLISKIRNNYRRYALHNTINVLLQAEICEDDVICILDGDDIFPHTYVLSILNMVYQHNNVEFTYGSMSYFNSYGNIFGFPYSEIEFNNIRVSPWKVAPLRSFKFKLFKELLKKDPNLDSLKGDDNEFLRMPADMALSFSLLEVCDFNRVKFIPTPMYKYRVHIDNDMYVNREEQYAGEILVRAKPTIK